LAAFATLLAPFEPFERSPRLAVAVSGGPDSLALCLLAHHWASARGGSVTALIVDHGLRPGSRAEARQVAVWLDQRGISHRLLAWRGPKPATGIQAAARAARYVLLADWCRGAGVLHLLLGHHRDDQAETIALRRARGSGPDGLAGMAPVREIAGLRLLRPLLSVPKERLRATLRAAGQAWIEDPSNQAPRFARTQLRQHPPAPVDVARCAKARAGLDRRTASWLAAVARVDPAGFVTWPRAALAEAPPEIARRALQQALATVGGGAYPPRSVRLERLLDALLAPGPCAGRTLAGCRILDRGGALLICREPAAIAPPLRLSPNVWQHWDERFAVRWRTRGDAGPPPVVRALGTDGWRECRRCASGGVRSLPAVVRAGLASVWRDEQLLAVAGLGPIRALAQPAVITLRSWPRHPLAGAPFGMLPAPAASVPYLWAAWDDTFASI
jgi:tRNA(Ile)-lysidine synthase